MTTMTPRRDFLLSAAGAAGALALPGCASMGGSGWTTLVDGSKVPGAPDGWSAIGEGNWSVAEGTLQGKDGKMGYLISKDSYTDFDIRAEFWADATCNSGIFLRCQDRAKVGSDNAYEVNIFDKRPDPTYGTAAIVDVAKVRQPGPMAADRWNTFEITAKGPRLVVVSTARRPSTSRTASGRAARWRCSLPVARSASAR